MFKKITLWSLLSFLLLLVVSSPLVAAQEDVEDWYGSYALEGSIVKGLTIEEDQFIIYYQDTEPEDFNEDPLVNEIFDWINRDNNWTHLVDPDNPEEAENNETTIDFFVELEEENKNFPEADHEIIVGKPQYKIIDGRLNVYAFKENLHFFTFDEENKQIIFQPLKGEALEFKKIEEQNE